MRLLAAAFLAAVAGGAIAQQAAPPPPPAFAASNVTESGVRAMAANCASCHGTRGQPAPGSSVAILAGRPADEVVAKMKAFKEGKAEATLMHQIARGYSDAEIAALAGYFAAQRP